MIKFECYPLSEINTFLKVITDHTEKGTLYRLATAIFVMDMDIFSGDIKTVEDEEHGFLSEDTFILRSSKQNRNFQDFASRLGFLMESLLQREMDPGILLEQAERKPPDIKEIFRKDCEYLIQGLDKDNRVIFYLEARDRPGLLLVITKFFYEHKINIVEATIRTTYDNIAKDSFLLEYENKDTFKNLVEEIEQFIRA